MIILKVAIKQGLILSLENTFSEKPAFLGLINLFFRYFCVVFVARLGAYR